MNQQSVGGQAIDNGHLTPYVDGRVQLRICFACPTEVRWRAERPPSILRHEWPV
jgi:hypothetical protein